MKPTKIFFLIMLLNSLLACNEKQIAPELQILGKWRLNYYGIVKMGETIPINPKSEKRTDEYKKDFTYTHDFNHESSGKVISNYSIENGYLIRPGYGNTKLKFSSKTVMYLIYPLDNKFETIFKFDKIQ